MDSDGLELSSTSKLKRCTVENVHETDQRRTYSKHCGEICIEFPSTVFEMTPFEVNTFSSKSDVEADRCESLQHWHICFVFLKCRSNFLLLSWDASTYWYTTVIGVMIPHCQSQAQNNEVNQVKFVKCCSECVTMTSHLIALEFTYSTTCVQLSTSWECHVGVGCKFHQCFIWLSFFEGRGGGIGLYLY